MKKTITTLTSRSIVTITGICVLLFGITLRTSIHQNEKLVTRLASGLCVAVLGYGISQIIRWHVIRKLLTYRSWIYEPRSMRTKIWGFLLSILMPKQNSLFDLQPYLPRYPLPSLTDTCKRTLEMVKPMLNEKEYELVVEALNDLQNNEGPELQKLLQNRYNCEDNWVAELWDKYAYLAGRSPLPVHSNFATMGDLHYKLNRPKHNQMSQAANVVHLCMEFNELIQNNTLSNMMIRKVIPICCDRYRYICSVTRIPGENIDELIKYPDSKHAVVFRKGYMYKLDVYTADKNGKTSLLTPKEIQSQIRFIMEDADGRSAEHGTGINPSIFTAADRSKWAQIRKEMLKDERNVKSLQIIESAVFCLTLETTNPQDLSEEFHEFLTGNGYNRWYDKSLTAIVTNNGAMGLNVEHSTAEATLSGRFWEYMFYHASFDEEGNATHRGRPTHDHIPTPLFIEWNLNGYEADIEQIKTEFDELADDIDTVIYLLKKGKGFIKKLRMSPDGFMQMALQLAFYRLHKETPKTYETASTRFFKNARTETIRSVSQHSIDFTKSFDNPAVSRTDVIKHLKNAVQYQTHYKYDAMNGMAVDRHLFGLYVAGKMTGSIPKLFALKPFYESDRLSTSQSPLRYDAIIAKVSKTEPIGGGFGAQRRDGYGVSYFVDEHKVHFLISSFKSCAETGSMLFVKAVEQAVDDMKELVESCQRSK